MNRCTDESSDLCGHIYARKTISFLAHDLNIETSDRVGCIQWPLKTATLDTLPSVVFSSSLIVVIDTDAQTKWRPVLKSAHFCVPSFEMHSSLLLVIGFKWWPFFFLEISVKSELNWHNASLELQSVYRI